jgi:hypothetical protein
VAMKPAVDQVPKTCVFCGNPVLDPSTDRRRAREHVFSSWALEEFGVARDTIEFSKFEAMRADGSSLQTTIQTPIRKFDLNNFVLGAVCSVCNNGWMSRLETQVKPNLTLLIKDVSATPSDRRALAKWAVKTVYVLWRYLEPPVGAFPRSHGKQLIGDGMALPRRVAVFSRQAADWRVWFSLCTTYVVETANFPFALLLTKAAQTPATLPSHHPVVTLRFARRRMVVGSAANGRRSVRLRSGRAMASTGLNGRQPETRAQHYFR